MSFERLVNKVRDNDVILWVGSGFSLYAGMPTGEKLVELLLENCSEEEKESIRGKSLADASKTFVEIRYDSRTDLHKILRAAIDIAPLSLESHKLLKEIPQIDTIVTTNYDLLFEEAYGREISQIINDIHIPLADKRVKLYKIHGDINSPETIVITNSDYTDFFGKEDKPMWSKIKSLMAEKTIIFLGYSLSDQNIEYLFDKIIKGLGNFQKEAFLVAPGQSKHVVNRLVQKKVNYIDMTGEAFVEKLHEEVKKNS